MSHHSHQTVKLATGKHTSPSEGVCVMELASMLGDEPFTDHPRSVCPVIATLLRTYNDTIDHARRQDLYAYAAKVVGTRSGRKVRLQRARTAVRFFAEEAATGRRTAASRLAYLLAGSRMPALARACARYTSDLDDDAHSRMLSLVDRLIALGGGSTTALGELVAPDVGMITAQR